MSTVVIDTAASTITIVRSDAVVACRTVPWIKLYLLEFGAFSTNSHNR